MTATPPTTDADWVHVGADALPVADALAWATRPDCGGMVTFTGTVRDHSPDHPGVVSLEYEAYLEYVEPVIGSVVAEARRRWPVLGRVAALHRTGLLHPTDVAVAVVVSAPHRDEAFAAARFCIDELKRTAPIWKRETWAGGAEWVACHDEGQGVPPITAPAASTPGSLA